MGWIDSSSAQLLHPTPWLHAIASLHPARLVCHSGLAPQRLTGAALGRQGASRTPAAVLAPAPAAGLAGARGGLGGGGVAGLNTALTQQGLANRTAGAGGVAGLSAGGLGGYGANLAALQVGREGWQRGVEGAGRWLRTCFARQAIWQGGRHATAESLVAAILTVNVTTCRVP